MSNRNFWQSNLLTLFFLAFSILPSKAQTGDGLLAQAEAAMRAGQKTRALELATEAIQTKSTNPKAYLFRGILLAQSEQREAAISDYSHATRIDPKLSQAYNLRGQEYFKLARIKESVQDFDQAIKLRPGLEPYHWQRGISLYYAQHYVKGRKQFELHQLVNPNDVENAIWHFLCVAKLEGVVPARQLMIPIENDRRVPMMEIDALFRGKGTAAKVMQAARAGNPTGSELNWGLFYANLYLGLYYEALGNRTKALEHIQHAAQDSKPGNYMAQVARVHLHLSQ